MELALYHPELGYYARADRRSGRAGDFFTSVDAGPLFGELLERQLSEMAAILNSEFGIQNSEWHARIQNSEFQIPNSFDLVDAGARRVSQSHRHRAATGLARRNQPARV